MGDGGRTMEDCGGVARSTRCRHRLSFVVCPLILFLLDHFAEEGEDEERENCAPDEGVEDHQHPPEDTFGGSAESAGDGVARLAEETALEDQEQDEVDDAERDVCE